MNLLWLFPAMYGVGVAFALSHNDPLVACVFLGAVVVTSALASAADAK